MRKLFEPQKYPGAPVHELFNKYFPPNRCAVCAIGFQPSKAQQARLDHVQANYTAAGQGMLIFRAAAAVSGGALAFGGGGTAGHVDINMKSGQHTAKTYAYVRSISLEHIVRHVRAALDRVKRPTGKRGRI
eukprot:981306-Prymnesium_polylepis.1